jgi:predicted hydrocarbon binding protein
MDAIAKSGYHLPNRLARTTLLVLEDMVGDNEWQALLNLAHLEPLIDELPPASLARGFDFADYGALNLALEEMYGERGGHGLALRAGRALLQRTLDEFGTITGMGIAVFKLLPFNLKAKLGLRALARVFNTISDQRTRVEEEEHAFHYLVLRNPVCWARREEDKPVCYLQVGLLQEFMHRLSGGREFRVDEAQCKATGAPACRFVIQKEAIH